MKYIYSIFLVYFNIFNVDNRNPLKPRNISTLEIETIYVDWLLSIPSIALVDYGSLSFAANNGIFGLYNPKKESWVTSKQMYDSLNLHFRAVSHTSTDFFMLSIESPALLFKTGDNGNMQMVYKEEGRGVI